MARNDKYWDVKSSPPTSNAAGIKSIAIDVTVLNKHSKKPVPNLNVLCALDGIPGESKVTDKDGKISFVVKSTGNDKAEVIFICVNGRRKVALDFTALVPKDLPPPAQTPGPEPIPTPATVEPAIPPTDSAEPHPPETAAQPPTPPTSENGSEPRSPFFDSIKLWLGMLVVTAALSIIILMIGAALRETLIGAVLGTVMFFGFPIATIIRGWTPVPENWEYRIQVNGKDINAPFQKGLHLRFPWLGFSEVHAKVFMGVQIMQLFLDEKNNKPYSGGGDVEFKDLSAPVIVKVFFKISDSFKATYSIGDVFRGIEEKMDERVRLLLGGFTFDEANTQRKIFNVGSFTKDLDPKTLEPLDRASTLESDFRAWGVAVNNVSITDIVLPEQVKKQREKVLEAAKNLEIADNEAKRKVRLAEGTRDTLELEGEGFRKKIESLVAAKLSPSEAHDLISKLALYEKVDGRSLVIESSGGSMASVGAMFGAGFRQANQDHVNKEGDTK